MTFTHSLSLIVAEADVADANKLLEALGRGPGNFSIPLAPTIEDSVTHRGCHTYDDELASIIASRVVPGTADLTYVGLSQQDADTAIAAIRLHSVPGTDAQENFEALAETLGLVLL